jgi:hypothetical protein
VIAGRSRPPIAVRETLRDVLEFSHVTAKSIAQRGFKAANGQPSRLDSFIASLRDVRRQI